MYDSQRTCNLANFELGDLKPLPEYPPKSHEPFFSLPAGLVDLVVRVEDNGTVCSSILA
jgi:hypothetical protein